MFLEGFFVVVGYLGHLASRKGFSQGPGGTAPRVALTAPLLLPTLLTQWMEGEREGGDVAHLASGFTLAASAKGPFGSLKRYVVLKLCHVARILLPKRSRGGGDMSLLSGSNWV